MGTTRAHGQNSMKTPLGEPGAVKNSEICRTLPSETKVLRPNLLNHGELHHHMTLPPARMPDWQFSLLGLVDLQPNPNIWPSGFSHKKKRASPRTIVERNAKSTSPTTLEQFDRMMFLPKFSKSWDLHLNQTLGFSFAQILFVENLYNRFWWFFLEAGSIFPVESNCARSPGGNTTSGEALGKVGGSLGKFPSGIRFSTSWGSNSIWSNLSGMQAG